MASRARNLYGIPVIDGADYISIGQSRSSHHVGNVASNRIQMKLEEKWRGRSKLASGAPLYYARASSVLTSKYGGWALANP